MLSWRIPERERDVDRTVAITFWCHGSYGAQCSSRTITVPTWGDIRHNYAWDVVAKLDALMVFAPAASGQLIL